MSKQPNTLSKFIADMSAEKYAKLAANYAPTAARFNPPKPKPNSATKPAAKPSGGRRTRRGKSRRGRTRRGKSRRGKSNKRKTQRRKH